MKNTILTYEQFSKMNNNQDYDEYIKQTKEYQLLDKLYNNHLNNLSNIIDMLNINTPYDLSLLYTYFLIPNGILSITDTFKYHKNTTKAYEFINILGPKVLTGTGVCRHIVKHLSDINQTLNFDTYILIADSLTSKIKHALLGISEQNQKFLFDPTNKVIGIINNQQISFINPLTPEEIPNLKISTNKEKHSNFNYLDTDFFFQLESKTNFEDFQQRYEIIKQKYDFFKDYFQLYKVNNYTTYQQICQLLEQLNNSKSTKKLIKK